MSSILEKLLAMPAELLPAVETICERYGVKPSSIERNRENFPAIIGGQGRKGLVASVDIETHILTGGRYRTLFDYERAVRRGEA